MYNYQIKAHFHLILFFSSIFSNYDYLCYTYIYDTLCQSFCV